MVAGGELYAPEAAAALGMRAIKVVSEAQALADLAEATGLSFGGAA